MVSGLMHTILHVSMYDKYQLGIFILIRTRMHILVLEAFGVLEHYDA